MAFLAYCVLFHTILSSLFQFLILQKCYLMFSNKFLRANSTPILLLLYCYLAFIGITSILYNIYLTIFWRPDEIVYGIATLYLIGIIPWIVLISNPIFEIGLCIERTLVIAFPGTYFYRWKKSMCVMVFVTSVITIGLCLWLDNFITLPSNGSLLQCRHFACFVTVLQMQYMNIYKIFISAIEIASAFVLLYFIKFHTISLSSKNKKKNTAIFIVVFATIIFEIIPNIIDVVVYNFYGMFTENLIGPYHTTLSSINLAINAVLYTHVLEKSQIVSTPLFLTTSTK